MATVRLKQIKSKSKLPLEILKCRLLNEYKPLVVLFYVTDRCNLKCRYCVGNWSGRKIQDFSINEIKQIVDQCHSLGTVHFTIHGGEILVRNDTKVIVDYLKKKGMYVNLVTNGLLLPEKIDEIENVDSLCISLDGREANHDFNRGKGSYRAAMKAIKVARSKGLSIVVHAALTKRNVADIEYLCRQAKALNYYQQFSLLLKPLDRQKASWGISDAEARAAIRRIMRLKRAGYPVFTSHPTLQNALKWPFSFTTQARITRDRIPSGSDLIRCFYGKLKIAIDANGYVYPCSSLNDSFKALNVREVGVKRAFEHVLATNDCEACYYLTQNDWSRLLGGSMGQFANQACMQLKGMLYRE